MENCFSNLKVVLVEPQGSLNVGSIARLCANFDVNELRIVTPRCDIKSLEAKKMALKGQKFLNECKIFNNLQEAIFDCDLVLASCGRVEIGKDSSFDLPEDISRWIRSINKVNNLAVLFGREDRGLTNQELLFAHRIFAIPTSKSYPSLNISHAVAVILYELKKSSKNIPKKDIEIFNLASSKQINDSFVEVEEMLKRVGYLLTHTSRAKISKFKKYILRANTSSNEMNVLRGIVHQINWFLDNSKKL